MLSNDIDKFIDALILLIKVNRKNNTTVLEIVQHIINQYHEELKSRDGLGDILSRSFVSLLENMIKIPQGFTPEAYTEKKVLILKFLNSKEISKDKYMSDLLRKLLDDDIVNIDYSTTNLEKRLTNGILFKKLNKFSRKMSAKLNQYSSTADLDLQSELLGDIRIIAGNIENTYRTSNVTSNKAVESVDFSNKESLRAAQERHKSKKSQILRTGLQGINRMLGTNGGFSLGETCMIYALTHHFKSGLMMSIARGLVRYNTPNFDPKLGQPLILFITLENEASKNMMSMYIQAYEQTYQRSAKDVPEEEIIEFVHEFFSSGGYTLMMERWDGTSFGIEELTQRIDDLRLQGYNIVAVLMDYMQLMKQSSKTGVEKLATHAQLSLLTYTLCAKCKNENMLFITPHQLEGEASRLAASGVTNIVKKFGQHNVSGSKEISRHVDFEMFIHLETNHLGQRFLTIQRGKHRSTEVDTPMAHRYCAYKFSKYGGIQDDINSAKPGYVTDIYDEEQLERANCISFEDISSKENNDTQRVQYANVSDDIF